MLVAQSSSDDASPYARDLQEEAPSAAQDLGNLTAHGAVRFRARRGRANVWIVAAIADRDVAALRAGHGADALSGVTRTDGPDAVVFEYSSRLGAFRTKLRFPSDRAAMVRCTTSFLPAHDVAFSSWPRDLCALGVPEGTVYTAQRGLRSGIVFAGAVSAQPYSLFYLQDFTSLTEYFETTGRSPAGSVGGTWPHLGYCPPAGDDCTLPMAREVVVSDAFLTVADDAPLTDAEVAARYLDVLAETYVYIARPATEYFDWPAQAARTLQDLSVSPACTYVREGRRYAMPYVGDREKPPESMVQMTLLVNVREYDRARGASSELAAMLRATLPSFFDERVGTLVRWLPNEAFAAGQADDHMSHEAMDSWYLHHTLFNVSRLASDGDAEAKALLLRSLPFAVRAARRFNYRWPIFFSLYSLDVIQAEGSPGQGGETDVGGLYALVMLHAHELFGDDVYLAEAERGVESLRDCGMRLGYQMNTTGFAAEAAMRLWKKTGRRLYLELSEICMANLFDNMWLWECGYGNARHYTTFFGLFPLRDAPYLAAYEELEAQAKFRDYLPLGGDDVRPSLRLLLAEYQRYSVNRGGFYYPASLPRDDVAANVRNGHAERHLAVPMEDLRDGREPCGQVGQEIYGAGLAFVIASRHYQPLGESKFVAYCDYPMYDFTPLGDGRCFTWRAEGDPRMRCDLRILPASADAPAASVSVTARAGTVDVPLPGSHTAEGHAAFSVPGGSTVQIRVEAEARGTAPHAVDIGGPTRGEA